MAQLWVAGQAAARTAGVGLAALMISAVVLAEAQSLFVAAFGHLKVFAKGCSKAAHAHSGGPPALLVLEVTDPAAAQATFLQSRMAFLRSEISDHQKRAWKIRLLVCAPLVIPWAARAELELVLEAHMAGVAATVETRVPEIGPTPK